MLVVFSGGLIAQQYSLSPVVVSSGGSYSSSGGYSLSATVGEIAVTTLESGSYILTQGFQQSYDIGVGIRESGLDWSINAWPNPVSDFLTIQFRVREPMDLNVEIMDITGRKYLIRELYNISRDEIVTFNLSGYRKGIYLVRVYTPDQRVQKVYKIQKF